MFSIKKVLVHEIFIEFHGRHLKIFKQYKIQVINKCRWI